MVTLGANLPVIYNYRICPNRSTVQRVEGLGCASINSNNKICRPVPTMRIYVVNRNRVDLCLQESGDLNARQPNVVEYCSNFIFLDNLLMFYQAFGVNLLWYVCSWRSMCIP